MSNKAYLLGRVFVGAVFAYMGLYKILNWEETSAWMEIKGLPMIPLLLLGAIVIELGGGIMLALGYRTKLVAFIIALFLVPTNLVFHNFWALPAEMQTTEILSFLQNIAIIGGLLVLTSEWKQKEFGN